MTVQQEFLANDRESSVGMPFTINLVRAVGDVDGTVLSEVQHAVLEWLENSNEGRVAVIEVSIPLSRQPVVLVQGHFREKAGIPGLILREESPAGSSMPFPEYTEISRMADLEVLARTLGNVASAVEFTLVISEGTYQGSYGFYPKLGS